MRFDRPAHPVAFDDAGARRCANGSSWTARLVGLRRRRPPALPPRPAAALRVVQVSDRTFATATFGQVVLSMHATLGPAPGRCAAGCALTAAFSYVIRRGHGDATRAACRFAVARYQCTPFMRLAIATCSIEAFSLASFSPFAAAESGKTL